MCTIPLLSHCWRELPLDPGICSLSSSQLLLPTPAVYVHTVASENPSRPVVSWSTHEEGRYVVINIIINGFLDT